MFRAIAVAVAAAAASISLYHWLFAPPRSVPAYEEVCLELRGRKEDIDRCAIGVSGNRHSFFWQIPECTYKPQQIRGFQTLPVKMEVFCKQTKRSYNGTWLFFACADAITNTCLHFVGVSYANNVNSVFFDNLGDEEQKSNGRLEMLFPHAVIASVNHIYEQE